MNIMRKEIFRLVVLVGLVAVFSFFLVSTTYGGDVTKITVSPGDVHASVKTTYKIDFTTANAASSTVITFPATFNIAGATLIATSSITGKIIATSTAQAGVTMDAGGSTPFSAGDLSVTIGDIVNPSQDGSYTITITTKDKTDGTGNTVDEGTSPAFYIQRGAIPVPADTTAPVSKINRPVSGATLTAGQSYLIEGTGRDNASAVTKVEVSVDGGKTWSLAKVRSVATAIAATYEWSYVWVNPPAGEYTIMVRATDAKNNVESLGPSVAVTVVAEAVPTPVTPKVTPEKPITEMTLSELQTKLNELRQTLLNLLQQLVSLLQQQLQALIGGY